MNCDWKNKETMILSLKFGFLQNGSKLAERKVVNCNALKKRKINKPKNIKICRMKRFDNKSEKKLKKGELNKKI